MTIKSRYRSIQLSKGVKKSALCMALSACLAGGVQAQSNNSGAVVGYASAGDTITIRNPGTGITRSAVVGKDGFYRFVQLPIGEYSVERVNADGAKSVRTARVNIGSSANVNFVSATASDATELDTVTVVGQSGLNAIDFDSVESTMILTSEQIGKIPVARNITQVALLAPGAVLGDNAFGNLASFGGASVAENQYYVNGFNITNSFQGLNFAQVPFEAIAEQQVKEPLIN